MRKNGVDRELRPILGGVCAPEGFSANAVSCGFSTFASDAERATKNDLALIVAEKVCPTACIYSTATMQGSPIAVTKKHLKNNRAQAILVNSGVANVFQENGEKLAEAVCKELSKRSKIDIEDIVIASTGKIGEKLTEQPFFEGIPSLLEELAATDEKSRAVVEAIRTTDGVAQQLSYEFYIGDVVCRIGAVFKGNACTCPNMATTLAFITTDVNITSAMLQRALSAEVKDSFNLLNLDNVASPNDMVCIMANGRAGNYQIGATDSEYKKFCYTLHEVAKEICLTIASGVSADGTKNGKTFICKAAGGKSKQIVRGIAKRLVGSDTLKKCLTGNKAALESMIFAVVDGANGADTSSMEICVSSENGNVTVCEDGKPLLYSTMAMERIIQAGTVTLRVDFKEGNYAAEAFGRLESVNKN